MKYAISMLILILAAVVSLPCFAESDYQIKSSDESSVSALDRPASSYTLEELDSIPKIKTMGCTITVQPDFSQEDYKKIIDKAILDIRNKDNEIDRVHMLVYDTAPEAVGSFNVAMVLWCPAGNPGIECAVTAKIAASNDRTGYETKIKWADKFSTPLANIETPPLENGNGVLVGRWLDERAFPHIATIREKGGKYFMEKKFLKDGTNSVKELSVERIDGEERLTDRLGNSFGDYMIIASDGTLKFYDKVGFIYLVQPQK